MWIQPVSRRHWAVDNGQPPARPPSWTPSPSERASDDRKTQRKVALRCYFKRQASGGHGIVRRRGGWVSRDTTGRQRQALGISAPRQDCFRPAQGHWDTRSTRTSVNASKNVASCESAARGASANQRQPMITPIHRKLQWRDLGTCNRDNS